jgi:hypothetical protein
MAAFRGSSPRPLPPAPASYPPRSLAVVPLIPDKRYYGETPVGLAGGSGAGLEEPKASGSAI